MYSADWQGTRVAVKVFKTLHSSHEGHLRAATLASYQKEARVLSQLRHENIIEFRAVAFDSQEGRVGIVTEFASRGSLAKLLRETGPLSPRMVCRVGLAVAKAMVYLNSNNIIHRDIKASSMETRGW